MAASRFADIFGGSEDQSGIVALTLEEDEIDELMTRARERAPYRLMVDLERIEGLDRIGRTLRHEEGIRAYETRRWPSVAGS